MLPAPQFHVAVDIGCRQHRVAIASSDGRLLKEFDITHDLPGFRTFFRHIARHERRFGTPVIAMEGFNGWARPLDSQIRARGYRLYNVNNLKLARFKEIFPAPAKTDGIDTRKMLELLTARHHLPLAKAVLQEVAPTPPENDKLKRLTRPAPPTGQRKSTHRQSLACGSAGRMPRAPRHHQGCGQPVVFALFDLPRCTAEACPRAPADTA